ncbi:MAG: zinc-dependent alcohol dehydrogenase [Spirochaetota bacterium]
MGGESGRARSCRSVYFDAPGVVRVRTEPVEPADGDVLVESTLIGISHGSERLFYRGPFPRGQLLESIPRVGAATDYPIRYGYMNVGRTAGGDRVFAFAPHQDRFAVRPDELIPIPDGIDDENAVLYPSVETALQICHDARPVAGEVVLVFGLGVIGQCVTRILARQRFTVIGLDPIASRRARASDAGVIALDPNAQQSPDHIRELTGGRGADIAIDVSSHPAALQRAIDLVAMEATIIEASWFGEQHVTLDLGAAFHRRRLTIRSSQVSHLTPQLCPRWDHARRTAVAWELVRTIEPGALITHRLGLDEAPRAYDLIEHHAEDVLQIVLVP